MAVKLLSNLQTVIHIAIKEKQYSAVAYDAKFCMKLVRLKAKIKSYSCYFECNNRNV